MSNSPRTSRPRYQKIRELGHNREGGRVTYLATDNATGQSVVIKQFQFAQSGSDWAGFKAYEREIQILRSLNHPGIPRYLNSFETPKGFCMVQEYKEAESLAVPRQWTHEEIKQIAISVLDILVYLQNRIPPIFHRDIKPENILVDDQMNIYLVDFGFARIGTAEGAMSSVAAGTFGFMAPEQIYNRELSNATDLYALGATLICLLTQTKSTEVETLLDDMGRFNFKPKVSKLNRGFINWLEKMVQPKQKDRYNSAAVAKEALIPLSFNVVPEVNFSQSSLEFQASKFGEKVTQSIRVSNPIPKTLLEGRWEVAPHPNDPPHTPSTHAWISFAPVKFKGNKVNCSITVDTSNLMADKVYKRQLILQTNSKPENNDFTIEVQTAPIKSLRINYQAIVISVLLNSIFSLFAISYIFYVFYFFRLFYSISKIFSLENLGRYVSNIWIVLFWIFTIGATIFCLRLGAKLAFKKGFVAVVIAIAVTSLLLLIGIANKTLYSRSGELTFLLITMTIVSSCSVLVNLFLSLVKEHKEVGFSQKSAFQISLVVTVLGSSLLIGLQLGLMNPFAMLAFVILEVVGAGLLLGIESRERKKLIDEYRQSEPHWIKP
jgi:serine/threonine protein kinase